MAFADSLLDKLDVWNGKLRLEQIEINDPAQLRSQLRGERGQLLVGAHLGNLEVCRALAELGEQVRDALTGLNFTFTENPDPARGLMSSFREAARALAGRDLLGVNFVLADMPLLTPDVHRVMIETFLNSGVPGESSVSHVSARPTHAPLVLSEYGTSSEDIVRAPPHLFRADLLTHFHELPDTDHGPRALVGQYAAQGLVVRFPANLMLDIDTPEALAQAEEQGWAQL